MFLLLAGTYLIVSDAQTSGKTFASGAPPCGPPANPAPTGRLGVVFHGLIRPIVL